MWVGFEQAISSVYHYQFPEPGKTPNSFDGESPCKGVLPRAQGLPCVDACLRAGHFDTPVLVSSNEVEDASDRGTAQALGN